MPARIEFIPYGNEWRPSVFPAIVPGGEITLGRRPSQDLSRTTRVIIRVCEDDSFTNIDYVPPGSMSPKPVNLQDGEVEVIHRAIIGGERDATRGTLRVSHVSENNEGGNTIDRHPPPVAPSSDYPYVQKDGVATHVA